VGWRVRKDGSRFYADDIVSPLRDHGDRLLGFVKITRDITERHQLEERFRAMFESAPIPLLMVNEEGNIMLANARVKKDFGYGRKELIGKPVEILIPERFRGGHFGQMRPYLGDGPSPRADSRRELLALAKDGHEFPVEIGLGAFKLGDQHLVLASINNITERKAMEEQIRQLAFYDTLTGLPNRRLLSDRLAQAMAASKRSGCYGALMFLDLDNFKPLNDTHGHAVGDLLLMEVANRLKGCVRETDTVARFGGDEFVVVLNELDLDRAESESQAGIIAEKILASFSEPYLLAVRQEGGGETTIEHHCSASIGVALFVSNESGQEDILKWADAAMYQAKESGRSQIRFYQGPA
jgi:diguanylate cyclase (GGDEF)-like protein/PAS domain S-box-containing protein